MFLYPSSDRQAESVAAKSRRRSPATLILRRWRFDLVQRREYDPLIPIFFVIIGKASATGVCTEKTLRKRPTLVSDSHTRSAASILLGTHCKGNVGPVS
jgi:hypothetical protein